VLACYTEVFGGHSSHLIRHASLCFFLGFTDGVHAVYMAFSSLCPNDMKFVRFLVPIICDVVTRDETKHEVLSLILHSLRLLRSFLNLSLPPSRVGSHQSLNIESVSSQPSQR
jgi:hypothetical protein